MDQGGPYRRGSRVTGQLACPDCDGGLVRREPAGCVLHECDGCRGVWMTAKAYNQLAIDPHAQKRLLEALPRQSRAIESAAAPACRCPRCGEALQRHVFARRSGVPVDACRRHGIWFQRGELSAVLAYLLDPLAAPADDDAADADDGEPRGLESRRDRELREAILDSGKLPRPRTGWFWTTLEVLTRRMR